MINFNVINKIIISDKKIKIKTTICSIEFIGNNKINIKTYLNYQQNVLIEAQRLVQVQI